MRLENLSVVGFSCLLIFCCMPVSADPSLQISATPDPVNPGEEIIYSISLSTADSLDYGYTEFIYDWQHVDITSIDPCFVKQGNGWYVCEEIAIYGLGYTIKGTVMSGTPVGTNLHAGAYGYYEDWDLWSTYNLASNVVTPVTAYSSPEFPAMTIPAMMIAGFISAVMVLKKNR